MVIAVYVPQLFKLFKPFKPLRNHDITSRQLACYNQRYMHADNNYRECFNRIFLRITLKPLKSL